MAPDVAIRWSGRKLSYAVPSTCLWWQGQWDRHAHLVLIGHCARPRWPAPDDSGRPTLARSQVVDHAVTMVDPWLTRDPGGEGGPGAARSRSIDLPLRVAESLCALLVPGSRTGDAGTQGLERW